MADPLSIAASLLAITTAAVQSTRSLYETIKRFRDRDKTLRRLQNELEDLIKILDSLTEVTDTEESVLVLLQGPIQRCNQVCREFEKTMKTFTGKSKTGIRDWTRMEFSRGDINEFIDTIAGYKSTISVGIGTITMQTSKVSHGVLLEYNEMIQDTAYNLEVHLQRIDEKMAQLMAEHISTSGTSIDLKDERLVTEQCLRICEDAKSYLERLSDRESSLLREAQQGVEQEHSFEAQLRTSQTLDKNRDSLVETIGHLSRRVQSLVQNGGSDNNDERSRLQSDIEISKQCLDICKAASEASRQKVYRIGEAVAEGDSDQVVVTTLADLFDIGKALSKGKSAQLVGSMTDLTLRHMTEHRYSSRFGALANDSELAEVGAANLFPASGAQKSKDASSPESGGREQTSKPGARQDKPLSNEMRKRGGN
ncbi:hypothetical protein K431DRAFT_316920 [Polychaeton citri CBS 116435]|uniref:Azaphilone pigments biosynthesis cluster protein L N-terminal domain-containing protein n=1 Tax=Polychaeton citri CBS 116435 TaxID=1314669 RepID=A0A9P4UHL6_9PEZI|nr:hypothetical protein K431DRAFT_316920 [Polychaeton citri CBS 116435]